MPYGQVGGPVPGRMCRQVDWAWGFEGTRRGGVGQGAGKGTGRGGAWGRGVGGWIGFRVLRGPDRERGRGPSGRKGDRARGGLGERCRRVDWV